MQVPGDCSCTRISVSSEGEAAATQSDKMGLYYLYGYHNGKHRSNSCRYWVRRRQWQ